MKNILLSGLLLISLATQAQNILRVNNIPGINAPYITIQAAVAAASAGDIILVEGSPLTYDVGSFSLTKKVTIKGPGYFLNENTSVQASQHPATINGVYFYFSSGSEGSIVSGLTFAIDNFQVRTGNITILNNRFTGNVGIQLTNPAPASNLLIAGNYITSGNQSIISQGSAQTFTSVVITNNYLSLRIQWNGPPVFGTIKNNIIGFTNNTVSNCDVANNIFLFNDNYAGLFYGTSNATIRNNVFITASMPEVNATNFLGASLSSLFTGNTTDTQWKLKTGSPAIGAGEGGIDCGIYGGITPYNISGVATGQPTITAVNVPGNVSQNGVLNVKVSGKVN